MKAKSLSSIKTLAAVTGMSLALAACMPQEAGAPVRSPDLVGHQWYLQSLGGHGLVGGTRIALNFDATSSVTGSGGCNRLFGAWRRNGDRLNLTGMGATKMACAGPVMQREGAFLAALDRVNRYTIAPDGSLVLFTNDNSQLVFR